jgi:hypothetical protein
MYRVPVQGRHGPLSAYCGRSRGGKRIEYRGIVMHSVEVGTPRAIGLDIESLCLLSRHTFWKTSYWSL